MGASGGAAEPVAESFQFRVTGTDPLVTSPGFTHPYVVPVYVIDIDGTSRASFEPGVAPYSRSEAFEDADPGVLGGPATGPVSSAVDPASTASLGSDFQFASANRCRSAPAAWASSTSPSSTTPWTNRTRPWCSTWWREAGWGWGDVGTITFTIVDNDEPGGDQTAPQTSFHHPLNDKVYKKINYLARTIHVLPPAWP